LAPLANNKRNPKAAYSLRVFDCSNKDELANISQLIKNNFTQRPEFKNVPENIKKLYCHANSETGLIAALNEAYTYAFVLKANDEYIGFLLVRFSNPKDTKPIIQIKRMHAFYEICEGRFFGVGKSLLNLVAIIGLTGEVDTLLTTAPYPIKDYFEHIGWKGEMIYTDYNLDGETVNLPQSKCKFLVNDQFKGF
jgi:hypothetical protein